MTPDLEKYRGAGLYNCCQDFQEPDWSQFYDFEIQALEWLPEHDCLEPIWEADRMHLAQFWTVYGHLHAGGVECITDCHTRKQAEAIVDLFEREHRQEMDVAGAIIEARSAPKQ